MVNNPSRLHTHTITQLQTLSQEHQISKGTQGQACHLHLHGYGHSRMLQAIHTIYMYTIASATLDDKTHLRGQQFFSHITIILLIQYAESAPESPTWHYAAYIWPQFSAIVKDPEGEQTIEHHITNRRRRTFQASQVNTQVGADL